MSKAPANSRVGEVEDAGTFFDRNLTHRGRHERLATLPPDQFRHFHRAPAFQRQHPHSTEAHARF